MDNMKLGQLTPDQEWFLDYYFTDQEVDRTKVYDLVSSLAGVPSLRDVRMELRGGLTSWGGLKVVADMDDTEFSIAMDELRADKILTERERQQCGLGLAVSAYERLEQALGQSELFQRVDVKKVPVFDPLEKRTEVDHYALQGSVLFGRNEGTQYKVDLPVTVELRVKSN